MNSDLVTRIEHYPRRDGPLPEGARWVGRPSRWGNPYTIKGAREAGYEGSTARLRAMCVTEFRRWLSRDHEPFDEPRRLRLLADLPELATARFLACACPLDGPCHADVLVEMLRAEKASGGTDER